MSKDTLDKEYPLYIPENFDIDKLVQENPPTFPYHRDYFIYIVHLITDIPSRNKNDDDVLYVSLHSSLLQRRVRKYNLYLNYLVENKVLVCDRQYIVGEKSKGYKFYDNYETEIIETSITKKTLIKSIKQYIHIDYSQEDNQEGETINDGSDLNNLSKWFNDDLTVDFLSAKQYLRELRETEQNIFSDEFSPNAMRRYNSRLIPLIKLNTQNFAHTIDSTAGRMHTALTQLKSDLRPFIKYDGNTLVAVDITNSQPYLSTILFNSDKYDEYQILSRIRMYNNAYRSNPYHPNFAPYYLRKNIENATQHEDVLNYIDIVKSGELYERFGELLQQRGLVNEEKPIRKQAKEIIFSAIFSPNQAIAYKDAVKIFKENFPNVYEIFKLIKQSKHRTLACVLQNLEAYLVLHTACRIIAERRHDIPLFTLHDAIITTSGNEDFVEYVLSNVLNDAIGFPPTLKIEPWIR
ncbi:hypothetical protein KRE49_09345 [Elizabethkingia meningoseptica]|uniref:hypothetical protein n=1 Tax=Elizabethkingia meningoseptica TaxID=238 RepID=UPI0021A2EDE7|nr:hypothetical protein [Elizabethkingia meningoseptica]MCT3672565.1 hypothetical protein [Elizabethkingia anophelis]MCT3680365.1 hypothetical protein [Elizabethkingia anophelis]MDE5515947.1 hypothetical protein [Elizabethkingia meningoseptica]